MYTIQKKQNTIKNKLLEFFIFYIFKMILSIIIENIDELISDMLKQKIN